MNKRGIEGIGVGSLIMVFIAVVVAVSLLTGGITKGVGTLTTKDTVVDQAFTFPNSSAATTYITLNGQAASSVVIRNATGALAIPSSNYSVTNYIVDNGALVTRLTAVDPTYAGYSVKVNYTSEPFGYDTNAGGRAVSSLIILLSALALAIVVLVPVIRNGLIDFFD